MSRCIVSCMSHMDNYIQVLLSSAQQRKFGIGWNDSNFTWSVINFDKTKGYHLHFSIPYAKKILIWEMYFNPLFPELGPDIIFEEEEYLQNKSIQNSIRHLPSLVKWNPADDTSLLKTLVELLQLYKQYQIQLLKTHAEKLSLEYNLLLKRMQSENIEISVIHGLKQTEVRFLMKLNVNLPIILFLQAKSTSMEVLLFVHFLSPTRNLRVTPEVYMPTNLQRIFDDSEPLLIPPLLENQHLVDYIVEVKQYITNKVTAVAQCIENRKKFITTLLVLQYATVLEYDFLTYRRVSLFLEHLDFYFILSFILPINFPVEQFSMALNSVYHMTEQGKPVYKKIEDFPYCPRWDSKQMIIKALTHILEHEIKAFQESSVKNCRI